MECTPIAVTISQAREFQTQDQLSAAMQTHLYLLSKQHCIVTWVRLFEPDVFATFFEMSREMVEVR
jgi:hypothetical protein